MRPFEVPPTQFHMVCDAGSPLSNPINSLTRTRGGVQTKSYPSMLLGLLTTTVRECKIQYEERARLAFGEVMAREDHAFEYILIAAVYSRRKRPPTLIFDVTVTVKYPFAQKPLTKLGLSAGSAMETMRIKRTGHADTCSSNKIIS